MRVSSDAHQLARESNDGREDTLILTVPAAGPGEASDLAHAQGKTGTDEQLAGTRNTDDTRGAQNDLLYRYSKPDQVDRRPRITGSAN